MASAPVGTARFLDWPTMPNDTGASAATPSDPLDVLQDALRPA